MIEVTNLTKKYGTFVAVNDVSFTVEKGEILGFLGPNGAGKTTTMKVLTCFLPPTQGTVTVDGFDVTSGSLEVRRRLGYFPESAPLYHEMAVFDYLKFIADVRNISRSDRKARIKEVCETCGITNVAHKDIGELSKGYRQRVGLAQALIHDPPILILDEPTSGLDPNQIVEIRELIRRIGQSKTVILSTHILPEVQSTCSRVLIIAGGKIVADGTPEELQRRGEGHARFHVKLEIPDKGPKRAEIEAGLRSIAGVSSVKGGMDEGPKVPGFALEASGSQDLRREIFRFAVDKGLVVLELQRDIATLEDVFRHLTTH